VEYQDIYKLFLTQKLFLKELANFIREGHFSSVGIFTYSKESETDSFDLDGHIAEELKQKRRDYLMQVQQEVVEEKLPEFIGKEITVLIEGEHEETDLLFVGRAEFQAPEVDGTVIINDVRDEIVLKAGEFRRVLITETSGYDLVGTVVG